MVFNECVARSVQMNNKRDAFEYSPTHIHVVLATHVKYALVHVDECIRMLTHAPTRSHSGSVADMCEHLSLLFARVYVRLYLHTRDYRVLLFVET